MEEHQSEHDPLSDLIKDNTSVKKSKNDDLLDIHIGNPLRRITQILEEIKKQKAFTFDIKGSLGIAGIALTLGAFGIFGGTKALCSKGIQTKVGKIQRLAYLEEQNVSILNRMPVLNMLFMKPLTNRILLVGSDGKIVHLAFENKMTPPNEAPEIEYFATGLYDSCSETLTVDTPNAFQSK
mgnify:CR=1 FL=1